MGDVSMIAFLQGEVISKDSNHAVLCVNGVGFALLMSEKALTFLPEPGNQARVITYLAVSETALSLYGFMDEQEENMFRSLIAVSGIGPKMALATLSAFTPEELIGAVTTDDVKALSKVPGIGKKLASRMVLELKGALPAHAANEPADKAQASSQAMKNTVDALSSMGFTRFEINDALAGAPHNASEEVLLQYALKRIS